MMGRAKVGFVMLVHQSLHRAEQVARYWAQRDCPVVIHVDRKVARNHFDRFVANLSDCKNVLFSDRRSCEWGTFSIVEATQIACTLMLEEFPAVTHVFLASGSCLPLRPVSELEEFLTVNPRTDFIESATTEEVSWTVGGLDHERFTLHFPFSWKRHRKLFDRYVDFQRRIGFARAIPRGLEPHLGSQWWCLTRQTLSGILEDPNRKAHDRYFRRVWIPDESYFQSLARKWSTKIESRSLTLSRFDHQGRPHIFYDDHLQLLRRSDCFVARKIWSGADGLYSRLLSDHGPQLIPAEPNSRKLEKVFSRAIWQRTVGRTGLLSQSRFPNWDVQTRTRTCAPYTVFEGFTDLFERFDHWLERRSGMQVHGHLFSRGKVEFADDEDAFHGNLSASAKLRDYNPEAFLTNLIWNTQGTHQCFMYGPADRPEIGQTMARDRNARIFVISGAWAVPLFHSNLNFARIRKIAARYQRLEARHLADLRDSNARADIRIWSLAEFVEDPMAALQLISDRLDPGAQRRLTEVPRMIDLTGFGNFLRNLRNQGMNPHLVGDFTIVDDRPHAQQQVRHKPYVVGK